MSTLCTVSLQGDEADFMYFVKKGKVLIKMLNPVSQGEILIVSLIYVGIIHNTIVDVLR